MTTGLTPSLVKYEPPVLVTTKDARIKTSCSKGTSLLSQKLAPHSTKGGRVIKKDEISTILDTILPPREYDERGKLWIQSVSRTPASRFDVINLQERLDFRLRERKGREGGICPIRRELYDQCFDELIRQETINCAERGVLLLRVRDELRMTLDAYESLYENSVTLGLRKAILTENGRLEIEEQVDCLMLENERLREKLRQQELRHEKREQLLEHQMVLESAKLKEEVDAIRSTNQLKMLDDLDFNGWYGMPWIYRRRFPLRRPLLSVKLARTRMNNILNSPRYLLPSLELTADPTNRKPKSSNETCTAELPQ